MQVIWIWGFMLDFVYDILLKQFVIYFVFVVVVLVVIGMLIVKLIMWLLIGVGLDLNEVINYGMVGFNLFYGLLLGLLIVLVYQNNECIFEVVLQEVIVLVVVYFDVNVYFELICFEIKVMICDYVLFMLYKDWFVYWQGFYFDGGVNCVNVICQKLVGFELVMLGQEVLYVQMLLVFQEFICVCQLCLNGVYIQILNVLWYVVLVGVVINIILIVLLWMWFVW